jgi:quercetin dioxygenase-like cupin family protein
MTFIIVLEALTSKREYNREGLIMSNIADHNISKPMVVPQIYAKALDNQNWKLAYATGKNAQIVFMHVSPFTNPNNEIGMETHPFDQVIIIVQGNAKVELDGEISMAAVGDMIFIPQGTAHNVINLSKDVALKVLSFYTDTDIPANSIIEKKADDAGE